MVLNSWPMKPSGVQLARPILPPRLAHAQQLGGGLVLVGREHHAEGRDDDVEAASANGSASASASRNVDRQARRPRRARGRARAAPARSRSTVTSHQRRAAASATLPLPAATSSTFSPGAQVEGLAQLLADDLQRGADDGVVARRPRGLLAGLDGREVGRRAAVAGLTQRWQRCVFIAILLACSAERWSTAGVCRPRLQHRSDRAWWRAW